MEDISDKFTVTPDGNMTYHGDKPISANMIFNPGDSLVRAHTVEESEPCGANESLVNLNPKVVEPVDSLTITGCAAITEYPGFLVNPFKDGVITDHELDESDSETQEWDGEGLPPVGTVCEWAKTLAYDGIGDQCVIYRWYEGDKLECLAHRKSECGEMVAVFWNIDNRTACSAVRNHQGTDLYQPIKSDKEIQVEKIESIISCSYASDNNAWAKLLYDGGCQIQESDDV